MTYFCSWWTWTCLESTNRRTDITVIIFFLPHHSEDHFLATLMTHFRDGHSSAVPLGLIRFSPSIPRQPNLNSSSVEPGFNFIQLITLLLRIFPASGCVIHLYPSQLAPVWWHMTAPAWVSTAWLISPLAFPLRDNGNEWQHVQNVSACYISCYQWKFGLKHRATSSPRTRPTGWILAVKPRLTWPYLYLYFYEKMLCGGCCDESASRGLNNMLIMLWVWVLFLLSWCCSAFSSAETVGLRAADSTLCDCFKTPFVVMVCHIEQKLLESVFYINNWSDY